jgi:hypothetical protein
LFPEYLELDRHKRMLLAVTETNPYFNVDQGDDTQRKAPRLTHIDGGLTNFCAYDYVGMAHDPAVTGQPGRDRSLRHRRGREPPRLGESRFIAISSTRSLHFLEPPRRSSSSPDTRPT